jgi:hypothetical protein
VNVWDNHEFSWQGWQSLQSFNGPPRPELRQEVVEGEPPLAI